MEFTNNPVLRSDADNALRLARMQGMLDGLTARVNGIDATLAAQAYCIDALQLKPEPASATDESLHCHVCDAVISPDQCHECDNCGNPTCAVHLHGIGLKEAPSLSYCRPCYEAATREDIVIEEAEKMSTTDDGPATCYICGIDHDLEDVATCTTCHRTVCHDHSVSVRIENERICKACDYDSLNDELVATLLDREHLRTTITNLTLTNDDLQASCTDTRNRLESETNMHLCARWQLEYADDAIDELQCQLLDAQQEHTKTMRLLSRLTTRAKNRLNSIGTIVDLETIDLSTPESEEE